jgi:hypothetical protein
LTRLNTLLTGSRKRMIKGTGKIFPRMETKNTHGQGIWRTNIPAGMAPLSSQIGVAAMRKTHR